MFEELAEGPHYANADALDCAWVLEGRDLEDVSEAEQAVRFGLADAGELPPALGERLVGQLQELQALAGAAADELSGL